MPEKAKPDTCLTPGCGKAATVRGVCPGCYRSSRYAKATGKVTDEELVRLGMLLPPDRQKSRGAFSAELEKWLARAARPQRSEERCTTKDSA
jgi:hypothetical protein